MEILTKEQQQEVFSLLLDIHLQSQVFKVNIGEALKIEDKDVRREVLRRCQRIAKHNVSRTEMRLRKLGLAQFIQRYLPVIAGQALAEIEPGTVVQISPDAEELTKFAGSFAVIDEVERWGFKGYVPGIADEVYPVRVKWDDCEVIGPAEWVRDKDTEEDADDEAEPKELLQ